MICTLRFPLSVTFDLPSSMHQRTFLFVLSLLTAVGSAGAQSARASTAQRAPETAFNQATYDSAMLAEFAWRPIGPAVTSGRVVDLAVDDGPAARAEGRTGKLMYAASASGGVW